MSAAAFAIIAYDKPNMDDARAAHRDAHIAHFKAHSDQIAVSGPMSDPIPGSLIIYHADTADEAQAFIRADPFFEAGVWDRIEVTRFKASMGKWVA
ncbi:MAG: YciI family protein [Pseudomonadota bacterium]